MELTKISNQDLLNRMDKLVQSERKLTHVILCHINEVESRRLYAELGFDSMFKYLTRHCGYGEDGAYRRLQAARLLKKNPEIAPKIEQGALNLTQLTQVQKCLNEARKTGGNQAPEQTLQVLEQIENKSSFETKKVLAVEFNQPIQTHEIIKPQRDESVRLELTFSTEQMEMLEQVKSQLSHVLPNGSWAEVISYLAQKQIKKALGGNGLKLKSAIKNETHSEITMPRQIESDFKFSSEGPHSTASENSTPGFTTARERQAIQITVRRRLLTRAQHCCEYVDTKTRTKCQSTYQLQIDHRTPLARGGSNAESNLRVLCRTHNLLAAKQWGLEK